MVLGLGLVFGGFRAGFGDRDGFGGFGAGFGGGFRGYRAAFCGFRAGFGLYVALHTLILTSLLEDFRAWWVDLGLVLADLWQGSPLLRFSSLSGSGWKLPPIL